MIGCSQPKTKSSRTLLRVVVSEIGLKSESTDIGLDILAIGTTSAHFHKVVTVPWLTDALKIEATGLQITEAHFMNTQIGILSGPMDLRSLIARREVSTAPGDIMNSSGVS